MTHVPNLVGLHNLTDQLPNQVGLQNWPSPLHDWILQFYIIGLIMTFSSNYKYDFYDQYQKDLKEDNILEPS